MQEFKKILPLKLIQQVSIIFLSKATHLSVKQANALKRLRLTGKLYLLLSP